MPSGHSIMTCRICVTLDQYIFASRLQLPMLDKLQVSVHVHACVRVYVVVRLCCVRRTQHNRTTTYTRATNATEVATKKEHVHLSAVDPSLARSAETARYQAHG